MICAFGIHAASRVPFKTRQKKYTEHYPSLRAKKYDEARGIWQARVTRGWRFYFIIEGDLYRCIDIMRHPK